MYKEFEMVSEKLTFEVDTKISEHNYKIRNLSIEEFVKLEEMGKDETKYISEESIFALIHEFNEHPSYKITLPVMRIYGELKEDKNTNDLITQYKDKRAELFSCTNSLK
ncbi:hypothetical protein LIT25_27860 (plasmid) [Bacillus sp. F19]|nr:hypothetical protein LIT25_27860 [Bacillus sp. F19]